MSLFFFILTLNSLDIAFLPNSFLYKKIETKINILKVFEPKRKKLEN